MASTRTAPDFTWGAIVIIPARDDVDISPQQRRHGCGSALVWNVHKLDPQSALRRASSPDALAWRCLLTSTSRHPASPWPGTQVPKPNTPACTTGCSGSDDPGDHGDRRQIVFGVVRHLRDQARRTRKVVVMMPERIAVRRRFGDCAESDRPDGAGAIFDHDRLPHRSRQTFADKSGDHVRCAARRRSAR